MSIDESSELLSVPIAHVAPSATNPRNRRVNQASNIKAWMLEEMAESIKLHGVMQPILVRANANFREGNGRPKYELVAGERRWRASQLAGKTEIPALLRNLTDFEVLELQVIENIQRQDLHPLEEADGYDKLLRKGDALQGYATVDELAARVGKSRRYVFNRLALLRLCKSARDALYEGTIGASVALVIATIPDEGDQTVATARILQGFNGEPYTARAAADYVQKEFRLTLSKARFDIKADFKVAKACGVCPKRSGANPDLFEATTSGDLCLDSKCFEAKTEEAHQATLQAARDAGYTVLSGDAARKLMPQPTFAAQGHQFFDKPCPAYTDSKKTLRDILGKGFTDVLVLDHPTSETAIAIVPDAAVRKALKAKGLLRPETAAANAAPAKGSTATTPPASVAPQVKLVDKPYTADQLSHQVNVSAGKLFSQRAFKALHEKITTDAQLPIVALRMLLIELLDNYVSAEGMQLLYEAQGWPVPPNGQHFINDLEGRISEESPRMLANMLVEFLVCEELSEGNLLEEFDQDSKTERLAKEYGIDLDALQESADAEARATVDAEQERRTLAAEAAAPKGAKPASATAAFAATAGKPAAKYRDPATGSTWSGRGLQPKWLKVALENGKKLTDFGVTA